MLASAGCWPGDLQQSAPAPASRESEQRSQSSQSAAQLFRPEGPVGDDCLGQQRAGQPPALIQSSAQELGDSREMQADNLDRHQVPPEQMQQQMQQQLLMNQQMMQQQQLHNAQMQQQQLQQQQMQQQHQMQQQQLQQMQQMQPTYFLAPSAAVGIAPAAEFWTPAYAAEAMPNWPSYQPPKLSTEGLSQQYMGSANASLSARPPECDARMASNSFGAQSARQPKVYDVSLTANKREVTKVAASSRTSSGSLAMAGAQQLSPPLMPMMQSANGNLNVLRKSPLVSGAYSSSWNPPRYPLPPVMFVGSEYMAPANYRPGYPYYVGVPPTYYPYAGQTRGVGAMASPMPTPMGTPMISPMQQDMYPMPMTSAQLAAQQSVLQGVQQSVQQSVQKGLQGAPHAGHQYSHSYAHPTAQQTLSAQREAGVAHGFSGGRLEASTSAAEAQYIAASIGSAAGMNGYNVANAIGGQGQWVESYQSQNSASMIGPSTIVRVSVPSRQTNGEAATVLESVADSEGGGGETSTPVTADSAPIEQPAAQTPPPVASSGAHRVQPSAQTTPVSPSDVESQRIAPSATQPHPLAQQAAQPITVPGVHSAPKEAQPVEELVSCDLLKPPSKPIPEIDLNLDRLPPAPKSLTAPLHSLYVYLETVCRFDGLQTTTATLGFTPEGVSVHSAQLVRDSSATSRPFGAVTFMPMPQIAGHQQEFFLSVVAQDEEDRFLGRAQVPLLRVIASGSLQLRGKLPLFVNAATDGGVDAPIEVGYVLMQIRCLGLQLQSPMSVATHLGRSAVTATSVVSTNSPNNGSPSRGSLVSGHHIRAPSLPAHSVLGNAAESDVRPRGRCPDQDATPATQHRRCESAAAVPSRRDERGCPEIAVATQEPGNQAWELVGVSLIAGVEQMLSENKIEVPRGHSLVCKLSLGTSAALKANLTSCMARAKGLPRFDFKLGDETVLKVGLLLTAPDGSRTPLGCCKLDLEALKESGKAVHRGAVPISSERDRSVILGHLELVIIFSSGPLSGQTTRHLRSLSCPGSEPVASSSGSVGIDNLGVATVTTQPTEGVQDSSAPKVETALPAVESSDAVANPHEGKTVEDNVVPSNLETEEKKRTDDQVLESQTVALPADVPQLQTETDTQANPVSVTTGYTTFHLEIQSFDGLSLPPVSNGLPNHAIQAHVRCGQDVVYPALKSAAFLKAATAKSLKIRTVFSYMLSGSLDKLNPVVVALCIRPPGIGHLPRAMYKVVLDPLVLASTGSTAEPTPMTVSMEAEPGFQTANPTMTFTTKWDNVVLAEGTKVHRYSPCGFSAGSQSLGHVGRTATGDRSLASSGSESAELVPLLPPLTTTSLDTRWMGTFKQAQLTLRLLAPAIASDLPAVHKIGLVMRYGARRKPTVASKVLVLPACAADETPDNKLRPPTFAVIYTFPVECQGETIELEARDPTRLLTSLGVATIPIRSLVETGHNSHRFSFVCLSTAENGDELQVEGRIAECVTLTCNSDGCIDQGALDVFPAGSAMTASQAVTAISKANSIVSLMQRTASASAVGSRASPKKPAVLVAFDALLQFRTDPPVSNNIRVAIQRRRNAQVEPSTT